MRCLSLYPSTNRFKSRYSGFTLVEIAIVLLIISLLVGGIVVGANLLRTAELKAVPEEIETLRQAVGTFRDKYSSLPGDMYNATQMWGEENATASICIATVSTGTKTCNGDGNGWITTYGNGNTYYEAHRFWQHLNNAGILPGHYTGERVATGTSVTCNVSNHCNSSKYRKGMYYAASVFFNNAYFRTPGENLDLYSGSDKGNVIVLFGSESVAAAQGAYVGKPLIPASDLQNLDDKLDDGKPSSGFIQSFMPLGGSSYLTNSCAASATDYNLADSTALCAIVFTNAF